MIYLAAADLEQQINHLSVRVTLISALLLIVLSAAAILLTRRKLPRAKAKLQRLNTMKVILFVGLAGTMICSTVFLFGSTIYLNVKADSGGPVHWHTDIEFWACGQELEFRDPSGFLSNKIGSATYHEHNDKRMHLEGVVVKRDEDSSLEKFMRVTDGFMTHDRIGVPLNEDESTWLATEDHRDGDNQQVGSPDDIRPFVQTTSKGPVAALGAGECGGEQAELQVFRFRYDKAAKTYSQQKLVNPNHYVMRDESVVPPGDCIIVEFDTPREFTDKLCQQYGVRDEKRCTEFGVDQFNPELCNIREVSAGGTP